MSLSKKETVREIAKRNGGQVALCDFQATRGGV